MPPEIVKSFRAGDYRNGISGLCGAACCDFGVFGSITDDAHGRLPPLAGRTRRGVERADREETQGAASIYTPTSVLGVTTGQLSLETPLNPTAGETRSYVDFYADNERLYMKREGLAAIALTSESARVTQFNVQRILAGARETAEIALEIKSRSRGTLETSSLVKASFTPRGSY
ncbi:MAG: hypothetical protein UY71_C0001G0043 [Parcubacteria group bacterium GW2011_GWB1_52_7]|nr:MAG: hypothetical protein UY71_C0001G0043 [Parcubacteria group bacterium GW2011_GWB1_52_7]